MRTSSMLTRQISGERCGVSGARKLIPMPHRISRAPGRPILIRVPQSTISGIVAFVFPGVGARAGVAALEPIRARSTGTSIPMESGRGSLRRLCQSAFICAYLWWLPSSRHTGATAHGPSAVFAIFRRGAGLVERRSIVP